MEAAGDAESVNWVRHHGDGCEWGEWDDEVMVPVVSKGDRHRDVRGDGTAASSRAVRVAVRDGCAASPVGV